MTVPEPIQVAAHNLADFLRTLDATIDHVVWDFAGQTATIYFKEPSDPEP